MATSRKVSALRLRYVAAPAARTTLVVAGCLWVVDVVALMTIIPGYKASTFVDQLGASFFYAAIHVAILSPVVWLACWVGSAIWVRWRSR